MVISMSSAAMGSGVRVARTSTCRSTVGVIVRLGASADQVEAAVREVHQALGRVRPDLGQYCHGTQ
jgi:hypothetical protein